MYPNVDLESARRYLSIIAPRETHFTFQTLDDRKCGAIAPRLFNGQLDECADALMEQNHNGAGVFVTVNRTNMSSREKEDMVDPLALWVEADNWLPADLPLVPSITAETSSGKHHLVFAVSDLTWDVFDRGMPLLAARYGGDLNAIDRSRVLRPTGFFHRKGSPWMVRPVDKLTSARSYSVEEIIEAFKIPQALPEIVRRRRQRGRVVWDGTEGDFEKVVSALRAIEGACHANGGQVIIHTEGHQDELIDWSDRSWWLKVGFCLHHFFGGSETGYALWVAASGGDAGLGFHGCPEKFDPLDQRRNWEGISSPPSVLNVPGRWRTIATIFWAARQCGWRQVGRPFDAPTLAAIHPSNDVVAESGKAAVALGLKGVLRAHDEQAQLRHSGNMLKLVKVLLGRVNPESGIGQIPPLQAVAREVGASKDTIRSYLNRLKADGIIIKSNGTGRALKGKGIAYAFTTRIITPTVADCYANASTTTGGVTDELLGYSPEVKTLLHADGGNGIEPWLASAALPPVIVDRINEARASGTAEKVIKRIAQEFWHLHNAGLGHQELVEAVQATFPDFERIAAGRARRSGRITRTERLDLNSLTASQYLSTFLRALGRAALARGLMTPEAQCILNGLRRLEEAVLARRRQGALEYLRAKDPG